MLKEHGEELRKRGLYIACDTAYNINVYMIFPYEQDALLTDVDKSLDAFNFYLSSCRIYIECAFGEFIMRWGIFWRKLQFDLKKSSKVIMVGMLLHNFIIENREDIYDDHDYFDNFSIDHSSVMEEHLTNSTGETARAIVSDNNEPSVGGRPTAVSDEERVEGERVRHQQTVKLASFGYKRPLLHNMKYNSYGHIYFES